MREGRNKGREGRERGSEGGEGETRVSLAGTRAGTRR